MYYDDFASVVQLGVGLHAGAALLQLYGEIGVAPVTRRLSRVQELVEAAKKPDAILTEKLEEVNSDFAIFRIQLFNEFKKYVVINSMTAIVLIALLIVISFRATELISHGWGIVFVGLSILPAMITVAALWIDASRQLSSIKMKAKDLEEQALHLR